MAELSREQKRQIEALARSDSDFRIAKRLSLDRALVQQHLAALDRHRRHKREAIFRAALFAVPVLFFVVCELILRMTNYAGDLSLFLPSDAIPGFLKRILVMPKKERFSKAFTRSLLDDSQRESPPARSDRLSRFAAESRFYPLGQSLVLILFLCALLSCGKNEDQIPTLVRIGPAKISQAAFENRLKRVTMLTPVDNAAMREALLQTMIDEQVLLLEAEARGLRESDEFQRKSQSFRTDAILDTYRDAIVDSRVVVQENEVVQAFALSQEKAAARHLYAPTLEQANALCEKLQAGATFEELAPQVFRDYRLASSGGYLGYFKWEEMEPTFAAEAQKLKKGEISKPVRTKNGYSIIKLEDRVRESFLTESEYGQQRKKLRWITEHRKRAQEIQSLDAEILTTLSIEFNQAVVDQLWQRIEQNDRDSTHGEEGANGHTVLAADDHIATVAGKPWTTKDFQERAIWTSERQRSRIQSAEDLKDFIRGLALLDEYLRRAKAAGFEKDPRVVHTIRENEDRYLLQKMESLLTDAVTVPLDSVRQRYDENPDDYVHPAMMKLREITVTDETQARRIHHELCDGGDFAELAKRYSIRRWSAKRGGEVGYVAKGDLGALGEEIFRLKPGQIGGPYQQGSYFTLVQVLEHQPSKPKTFEQARREIEEMLLPEFKRRAMEAQLKELRKPLTLEVDQAVWQSVRSPFDVGDSNR